MPKVSPAQTNFNGGEFSPLLYGRVDAERYKTGLATCTGYIPTIQGGLTRRSGTKYIAPTSVAGTEPARLQKFEFSTTQAYMLEFTDLKLRIYKSDRTYVTEASQAISDITQANPAVVTYVGSDNYANGDEVFVDGVVGMTEVNGRRFTVANVNTGANTFDIGIDSTGYTAYDSVGTVEEILTITMPYVEADLFELKFAQSADVLYISHPSYAPRKLSRTSDTSWTLTTIDFLDGPYLTINSGATTITPSATTGTGITLTASTSIFVSTDVGRLVRLRHTATWGYAKIATYSSGTSVTADVVNDFGATTATAFWRLGVWGETNGYPGSVTFHEDRLFWGGSTDYPQRIDGSKTSDYENMAPTDTTGSVADDNAVSFTMSSNDVQVIRWMASDEKGLLVGTVAAEWLVRPSSANEAISPTNISAKPSTNYGSANISPVQAGKSVLFVQKSKRKLRELTFVFESDGFRSPDLTQIAEHITVGGIVQIAHQQEPQSIVWAVRTDGTLVGMTYERDSEGGLRAAWHKHVLGGVSDATGTQAQITSVSVMPSADEARDELWMVVKRYIGGAEIYHVEVMERFFADDVVQDNAYFVDGGITYDGASVTTVGGLWHLEGETVSILADGAVQPDAVVANGQITIESASIVNIGYSFQTRGQMLRLDAGAADGSALGKTQRSNRTGFLLHRSLGLRVGKDFDNLDRWIFRDAGDNLGESVDLFSGVIDNVLEMGYSTENQIAWDQDQPLPSTILAIMPQLHTQDR